MTVRPATQQNDNTCIIKSRAFGTGGASHLDNELGLQLAETHKLASDVPRINDAILLRSRVLDHHHRPVEDGFHQLVTLGGGGGSSNHGVFR